MIASLLLGGNVKSRDSEYKREQKKRICFFHYSFHVCLFNVSLVNTFAIFIKFNARRLPTHRHLLVRQTPFRRYFSLCQTVNWIVFKRWGRTTDNDAKSDIVIVIVPLSGGQMPINTVNNFQIILQSAHTQAKYVAAASLNQKNRNFDFFRQIVNKNDDIRTLAISLIGL